MKKKKGERRSMKSGSASLVRASISFPPDLYETLEEIAKQKKVSLAWVVRDAAEKYVADQAAEQRRQGL
jgi:metal-responsive CopG/Arc/MetJ family transcriptional regulator